MISEPEFWVEADLAVKDHSRVIGYSVWHISWTGARECVRKYSANRRGALKCLDLANARRDALNRQAEGVS
jgi:hypothetical protein